MSLSITIYIHKDGRAEYVAEESSLGYGVGDTLKEAIDDAIESINAHEPEGDWDDPTIHVTSDTIDVDSPFRVIHGDEITIII